MNAFFKCAELGRNMDFPLKELAQNFPLDHITLDRLDRSLVKELAEREGGPGRPGDALQKEDKAESRERKKAGTEASETQEASEAGKNGSEAPETSAGKGKEASETSAAQKEQGRSGESAESRAPEAKDKNELTPDEINEKQREAIKDAFQRMLKGEKLTDQEKGNLCEMLMDQYYISQGYTPLHSPRVTSLDDAGHKGIDGVYQKGDHYIIADAKYGEARLRNTQDGRQMSWDWIDKRLDDAVGKEKADEIRQAREENPDNVSTQVYHFNLDDDFEKNGNAYGSVYYVNEDGEKESPDFVTETYHDGEKEPSPAYAGDGRLTQALVSELRDAGRPEKSENQA
ncbi:MAG: hypothetical protein K2O06_09255 [Acetatifactor sp.]|nr:hypothetical protein [Acetatifactor sp.]